MVEIQPMPTVFDHTIIAIYQKFANHFKVWLYESMKTIKHIFLVTLFVMTTGLFASETDHCMEEGVYCGCMDSTADNFDESANEDDGSCYWHDGCKNEYADNYDDTAQNDDGSCILYGCTDPAANNYYAEATDDDDTCRYDGCTES